MIALHIRVDRRRLSVASAYALLEDPVAGGAVFFLGRVRPDREARRSVRALLYEAHLEVAKRELARIATAAAQRFDGRIVVVWHRVGVVPVGEASVLVGVAAPHRDQAFRAARQIIDRLKRTAPIWKSVASGRALRGRR